MPSIRAVSHVAASNSLRSKLRLLSASALLGLLAIPSSLSGASINANSTVFIILMENHNWSGILANPNAPYINNTLLPMASYTDQYYNPPGIHPSLPNYLWLEAGTNFGVADDSPPSVHHQATTNHFVTQLKNAGITWKTYQEDISGATCPTTDSFPYFVKHNPFAYFDDVQAMNCTSVMRPLTELATDLANHTVAHYNFITPNICSDMHNSCAPTNNAVKQGDDFLAQHVPGILQSAAFQNNGVLFITFDEGAGSDGPIGMIVVSPLAKGGGFHNALHYTHSSTLRTFQKIFGRTPYLGGAANALDLGDLFVPGAIPSGIFAAAGRGDFDGDGFLDFVLYDDITRRTAIWYLHGNSLFSSAFGPTIPVGWALTCVADVNHDGKPDYVLSNASTRQTAIWYLNNATRVSTAYGPTLPTGWSLSATADFNNDGQLDYVLFNASTSHTAIWYLNGVAMTGSAVGPTLPGGWSVRDALDLNSDSKPDYLLFNNSTRQTSFWYLNGVIHTSSAAGPTVPTGWTLTGTGDFNGNARPDYVLFETSTRRTAIWYLNGPVLSGTAYGPTVPLSYSLASP